MSFGFSIGDFLEVARLIEATRKRFKGAPAECSALAAETKLLQIVVNDIDAQIEDDDDIADAVKQDLQSAVKNCESVLKDLNALLNSHTELTSEPGPARKVHQRVWKRLKWDSDEVNKLRSRLSSSIQLLESVRRRVDSAQNHDIGQGVKRLTVAQDNEEVLRIANWLAPATYLEQQNDYFSKVLPGTGQWLLTHPSYLAWRSGSDPTLLLPGIPGVGKTFLTSVLINDLQKHFSEDGTAALAFFYSNFRRTDSQSAVQIISSIIRQLFLHQPETMDAVKSLHEKHDGRRPSLEELTLTIVNALSAFSKVFFVIDALDECNGPDETDRKPWQSLLTLLFRLQEEMRPRVALQILVTFRPIPEVEIYFPSCERLSIRASEDDLALYCDAIIPKISCIARKTELHPQVRQAICKSAQGMFLLAKLHCDDLAAKTKPKDVLRALGKFAQGGNALDQAYENSMQRIQCQPEEHTELARKVLICITFGARPLTLDELRHAIAVDEGTKELDPEYDLDDPDVLISACAGLVTIDSESMTIRLVHYTTQSFLESLQDGFLSDSHYFLACCCLNYLLLDAFAEGHVYGPTYDIRTQQFPTYDIQTQQYPFFKYSAQFWTEHMTLGHTDTSLMLRAFTFLDNFGHVESAIQIIQKESFLEDHGRSPIHLLAAMGADQMLKDYINRGFPSDGMQTDRIACQDCKNLTSKHLDELKANEDGDPPLLLALVYSQDSIALQLLGEPDIVGPWYQDLDLRRCLPEAALRGYEAVVDRLLELAVDAGTSKVDATTMPIFLVQREVAGKALEGAAREGHLRIVKKLWRYSCDGQLYLSDWAGEEALFGAAYCSQFDVVQYLGNQETIQLDFLDDKGMSVLHHAACWGPATAVDYILKNFSNIGVDLTDKEGRTALSHAAEWGQVKAAQIMACEHNANVNFPDKSGMTPIMYAASRLHFDILTILAPLVSDINCNDALGKTVVHHLVVSYQRTINTDTVEEFRSSLVCLVKHGASLNARDGTGRTAYERLCDQETKILSQNSDAPQIYRQRTMERLKQVKEIMERILCIPTVS
ncbi:hypothetical protein LTR47_007985 [Exophiala xenobiotica]|nr:hypothetical protein LTR41_002751 [Exophiala xenobiotica]KAK5229094.1 hypothetical protein LTR47_007985 [Exophiala xenobiotica]KAK5253014.1 hypothetical protein LTS06_002472 [Exophiala xenobiotica]KAK5283603.1 hypothetical protein LTR40_001508 [Exophiala xenobiotica]KAK5319599.1 hypothetical protein LTR93_007519 [Exophiala xenobiotica]